MNYTKEQKDIINNLVSIYYQYNIYVNLSFKFKVWDIIAEYYIKKNKSYEDIIKCIEINANSNKPIWVTFKNYFSNTNKGKVNYKNKISDSTKPEDWF